MGKLPPINDVLAANDTGANTSSVVIQAVNPTVASPGSAVDMTELKMPPSRPAYPAGDFTINNARVVFVKEGTALLAVAEDHHISFARLLDFNDLFDGDVVKTDQLIFLQRKRKIGATEFHVV